MERLTPQTTDMEGGGGSDSSFQQRRSATGATLCTIHASADRKDDQREPHGTGGWVWTSARVCATVDPSDRLIKIPSFNSRCGCCAPSCPSSSRMTAAASFQSAPSPVTGASPTCCRSSPARELIYVCKG